MYGDFVTMKGKKQVTKTTNPRFGRIFLASSGCSDKSKVFMAEIFVDLRSAIVHPHEVGLKNPPTKTSGPEIIDSAGYFSDIPKWINHLKYMY